tara:strand:- start:431 stop:1207 length:777 start_codon:yes stop_codon:yes gene_type:complete
MKHGFSLVELSIVLVILGLLTGGILTGQSLIRAAEMRSVATEVQRYQTAVRSFQDKYFAIPGDMANATSFWGTMSNCGVASPSGSGTQTCNGNGDGQITEASASARTGENFGMWQQMANAGLIEGSYTGISGTGGTNDAEINENVPASKLSNSGWYMHYYSTVGNAYDYAFNYGNHFVFGVDEANSATSAAAMTTEEAWNIDTKLDDGLPASGKIIARFWNNACATPVSGAASNSNYNAKYHLTNTGAQCSFRIRNMF